MDLIDVELKGEATDTDLYMVAGRKKEQDREVRGRQSQRQRTRFKR